MARARVAIVFDGHRWWTRRVLCTRYDIDSAETTYTCRHRGGPYNSAEEAIGALARRRRSLPKVR